MSSAELARTGQHPNRAPQPSYRQTFVAMLPVVGLGMFVSPWFWWGVPLFIVGCLVYATVWHVRNS